MVRTVPLLSQVFIIRMYMYILGGQRMDFGPSWTFIGDYTKNWERNLKKWPVFRHRGGIVMLENRPLLGYDKKWP